MTGLSLPIASTPGIETLLPFQVKSLRKPCKPCTFIKFSTKRFGLCRQACRIVSIISLFHSLPVIPGFNRTPDPSSRHEVYCIPKMFCPELFSYLADVPFPVLDNLSCFQHLYNLFFKCRYHSIFHTVSCREFFYVKRECP